MYEVYNKALDDENGKLRYKIATLQGAELIKACEQFNVLIAWKEETDEYGEPVPMVTETKKRLTTALSLSWNSSISRANQISAESRQEAREVPAAEDFFLVMQNEGIGFYRLEPGDSVELRHNREMIDELVQASIADKLRITDTETGEVVWDGGLVDHSYEVIVFDEIGKKVKVKQEAKRIANMLHPEKERAIYYPVKEKQKAN